MSFTEQSILTSIFKVQKKRNYASTQTNNNKSNDPNAIFNTEMQHEFLSHTIENYEENKMNPKQDPVIKKTRKNRFGDLTEAEVLSRGLPDLLKNELDIVIVGINPGLTAAYVGHHYAGPGNHFWKCLHMSGLTKDQLNAKQDGYLMDEYNIGFTNIVKRTSRGSSDLSRKEIKEGGDALRDRLTTYKPLIVAFNGKGIYEVFCGNKDFPLGRQVEKLGDSEVFVMPSSSARCSQLPRAVDKVPYYVALKELRDYLKGDKTICIDRLVFPDVQLKVKKRDVPKNEKKNDEIKIKKESTQETYSSIYFSPFHPNVHASETIFNNSRAVKEEKKIENNSYHYDIFNNNNNNNNLFDNSQNYNGLHNFSIDNNRYINMGNTLNTTTTITNNNNNNINNINNNNNNSVKTDGDQSGVVLNYSPQLYNTSLTITEEDNSQKQVRSKYF